MPAMTADDLAEQLAECGDVMSREQWLDVITSPPDVQARILATMQVAAVRPGPDYLAAVLSVLKVGAQVVGIGANVESAIELVKGI